MAKIEQAERGQAVIDQAVEVLASGKLLVFPTETVYGIAASARSESALQALRAFKDRPGSQPFTIHLPDARSAERYISLSDPIVARLVKKGFPGPITIITDVSEQTITDKMQGLKMSAQDAGRLYFNGTVGLRCPDLPTTQKILSAFDGPVVASSANPRGQAAPHTAEDAAAAVGDAAELIVDTGPTRYSKPSTMVRVRQIQGRTSVQVVRHGVLDDRVVQKLTTWTMLVVCSGNTCRSPMAEGIAKLIVSERKNIPINELESSGCQIKSAGAFASAGSPASSEAVEAMQKFGIDLSKHRSQPLSVELINQADVIYCMGEAHQQAVTTMVSSAASKTVRLDPSGDIDDPIGSSITIYQRCAEVIRRRLTSRIQEQQL